MCLRTFVDGVIRPLEVSTTTVSGVLAREMRGRSERGQPPERTVVGRHGRPSQRPGPALVVGIASALSAVDGRVALAVDAHADVVGRVLLIPQQVAVLFVVAETRRQHTHCLFQRVVPGARDGREPPLGRRGTCLGDLL